MLSALKASYSNATTSSGQTASSSSSNLLSASGGAISVSMSLVGGSSSTPPIVAALVADTTAPTITMLQGQYPSQLFVTAAGGSGIVTNVTVGSVYVDPGATAAKVPPNSPNNPIDLTSRILVSGLSAVKTAAPTAPGAPFVVTYDVTDFAVPPNKARTQRRRVQVICKGEEITCQNSDGSLSCSFGGICGVAISSGATSGSSTSAALPGSTASSSSSGSIKVTVPTISVLGSSTVLVNQGQSYSPCSGSSVSACDAGALATLFSPGDLNSQMYACYDRAVAAGIQHPLTFSAAGVAYCGIDASTPGTYQVTP